jgi:hypothetical protein
VITKNEINFMKEAYGILYEIENRMRLFAIQKMEKEYGIHWEVIVSRRINTVVTRAKFQELHFDQIVSYYRVFPVLSSVLPMEISLQLYRLTSVRNKIAHNKLITELELERMKQMRVTLRALLKIKKESQKMTL